MNKNTTEQTFDSPEVDDIISVRAVISCPSGDYKKSLKIDFLGKI